MINNHRGALIVNADDWGCTRRITDAIFDCIQLQAVSSASAMVFMEDSERAAELARANDIDIGLHLNLTAAFTANRTASKLDEQQRRTAAYLRSNRIAQTVFNPALRSAFDYVVKAQLDEFERLYGRATSRIDGHHHMHLCENVLFAQLLPAGTIVRRNFTFRRKEKSTLNRLYRRWQDHRLSRRHLIADYFFALLPIDPGRLAEFASLASLHNVEIETHPDLEEEYRFFTAGGFEQIAAFSKAVRGYCLRRTDRVM